MFEPIIDDIKRTFQSGNMISKLIIINVAVFLVVLILGIFLKGADPSASSYRWLFDNLAISSEGWDVLKKPWTLITHMFFHEGLWHLVWNMLLLYWFGRIVGDFIGDSRILPLYIMGGLFGIGAYYLFAKVGFIGSSSALGASGAVMAIISASAFISPNYSMRLFIIGDVTLKYIVLFLIIWDLVGISAMDNTGGHIAHLGGVVFGGLFVYLLRQGTDLADGFNSFFHSIGTMFEKRKENKTKSPLTVSHKAKASNQNRSRGNNVSDESMPYQEQLDRILDKIKQDGYDNLTDEEKEFLFQASKR